MKKGLVLEGGAMRGMFTAGVMDAMMEAGITYDGAIGVSAGAAFGCNYKSKQIGRVLRYNKRFCADKRYSGIRSLLKTGNVYNTEFCYDIVPTKLDVFDFETYKKNPMEFYVVCTDIETGKPVYHKYTGDEGNGFDWIRASASMPLVSQIVEIDGKKLLDGGIADSIPVKYFESIGYEKNVAVLTQPKEYQKERNKILPLIRRKYKNYPNLCEAMEKRHIMYNRELKYVEQQEKAGKLFVIRPDKPLDISRVEKNPRELQRVYNIGRKTGEKYRKELQEFLK